MRWVVLSWLLLPMLQGMGQQLPLLIGLGEEAHGFGSLNDRKAHLLDSLARHGSVDAVIMESSFVGSIASRRTNGNMRDRMNAFVYPFWITDTIVHVLDSAARVRNDHEFLWGCDIQEDCRIRANTQALLKTEQLRPWEAELFWCDSILQQYIGKYPATKPMTKAEEHLVTGRLNWIRSSLINRTGGSEEDTLIGRCLENRIMLCHLLTLDRPRDRMAYRDSAMAVNIRWTLEHIKPRAPVVFWAADLHVRHAGKDPSGPVWCGDRLRRWFGDRYVARSIRHGKGRRSGFEQITTVEKRTPIPASAWTTLCP